jgi:hypothetical protein
MTVSDSTFRRWTADEIAQLKNLAQKKRPSEIASRLSRSPSAIATKAHELKLSLKVPRQADTQTASLTTLDAGTLR